MNIRTAWEGHGRIALVTLPLLTLAALAAIVILMNFRADQDEANRRIRIADQQIAISHVISEAALEIAAGDGVDDTIRNSLVMLDRDHYGLRYGNAALGVSGEHSATAERAFAAVEPVYDELRSVADRLAAGDESAAPAVVDATGAFRGSMAGLRSLLVDDASKRSATLLRVEVVMLLLAFLTTVIVFILAPEVKRRREEHRKLSRPSRPDHLTGLIRRDPLAERLQYAIARSAKLDEYASVLVVDVDGLTEINQRFGHAAGDRLLQELATRFKEVVRASDTVARLEDDRFAILIEGNHRAEDSGRVAEKLMAALELPTAAGAHELHPSVSIGIAVAPLDGTHPDDLLENAEVAMVSAKQLGGDTYQYYSPELKALTRGRLEMLDGLRRALSSDKQLRLAFQPKVDLRSGKVTGAEALIRWSHPEQGEILPGEFIPFAEETEVILGLGEWVIERACRQVAQWDTIGLDQLQVSVNVSARQFRNGDLAEVVAKAVADAGIEASRIQVELTEGALVDDIDRARETLAELQELGVTVAIDDFGTGYSSLSYLKRFPIDALKIDRSFVQELSPNSNEAAISTAIIALAHSLDLEVVAEGVEQAHQLAMLEELGCDTVQGFLFAKALPPADLEAFVGMASSPNAAAPRLGGRYVPSY